MKPKVATDNKNQSYEDAIEAAKIRTADAYKELLSQCVKLADALWLKDEYTLSKIMPRTLSERADVERIAIWVEAEKAKAIERLTERDEERDRVRKRKELLKKLKLTAEQEELLGISQG